MAANNGGVVISISISMKIIENNDYGWPKIINLDGIEMAYQRQWRPCGVSINVS